MSNFLRRTNSVLSSVQTITFKIYSFNGLKSDNIPIKTDEIHSFNGLTSPYISMKLSIYSDGTRKQVNLAPLISESMSFIIATSVENVTLPSIYSPIILLEENGKRYDIFSRSTQVLFDPSTVQVSVKRIRIARKNFMASFSWENVWYSFNKQEYTGIFTDAVNAKRIRMDAVFKIALGVHEREILLSRHGYLGLNPKTYRASTVNKYQNIISITGTTSAKMSYSSPAYLDFSPLDTYTQAPSRLIPLLGSLYARLPVEIGSAGFTISSRVLRFKLRYLTGESIRQSIAKKKYNRDFNGIISNEFNILRIASSVNGARFMDLNGLLVQLNQISIESISKDSLYSIPALLFYLAHNFGQRDYQPLISNPIHFEAERSTSRNATSLLSDAIEFSIETVPVETISLNGILSNWFSFLAGDKILIDTKGIYRDIFVDSTRALPGTKTPWTPREFGFFKVLKTAFQIISFNSGISAFHIKRTPFPFIVVTVSSDKIARGTFLFDSFQIAPFIRISTLDKSDFITMSATPVGGSIIHMHKKGYKDNFSFNGGYSKSVEVVAPIIIDGEVQEEIVLDSTKIERAAMTVSSMRYRSSAKIVKEFVDGVLWDEVYVNEAIAFLKTKAEETMTFIEAPYSPYVIKSISLDKGRGLIHKNIFQAPEIMTFPLKPGDIDLEDIDPEVNTPYIFEVIEDIADDQTIYEYVTSSVDIHIAKDIFPFHIDFPTHRIAEGSSLSIIENCAQGMLCSRWLASKASVLMNVISRPIAPKAIAVFDHIYKTVTYPLPLDTQIIRREVGTTFSLDSSTYSPFIHIVMNANRNGIVSNYISLSTSYGTRLNGLSLESEFSIGLTNLSGVKSKNFPFKFGAQDTDLHGLYSDFRIRLIFDTNREQIDSLYSHDFPFKFRDNDVLMDAISNENREMIWLKIFPEHFAGKTSIESDIMKFHVADRDFAKEFFFPFSFEDNNVILNGMPSKSGSGDFKEKKILEIPDILGPTPSKSKVLNLLCGENRETTLLEYSGFDHLLREGDGKLFGRLGWETKKLIMSPYITISTNSMIRDNVNLSDADALKRTLGEIKLSAIEDLDVVQEWHIEDFKLEAADFKVEFMAADSLTNIDDAFRSAMKSVLENLGSDASRAERHKGENQFPGFPERKVIGNELSSYLKPTQYFIVEEED